MNNVMEPTAKRTLFNIGEDWLAFDALLSECEGDISDPQAEAAVVALFEELERDEANKAAGYVAYDKQLEMEEAAAKAEAEQWLKKASVRANRRRALKDRLKSYMQAFGKKKIETADGHTITLQANGGQTPLIIDDVDPAIIPDELALVRREPSKLAVRKALEAGEWFHWARLGERGSNLRVK